MAPVSRTIASLTGGVSQQAASLRRPSQMEEQLNCFPSVVNGNKKRPPIEYVAKLLEGTISDAYVHTINRDSAEQYKVVLTNGDIKVFDFAGNPRTVTFPDGTAYLTAASPSKQFRLITIADYTFLVNTNVEAAMTADVTPTRAPEALIFVKQGENDVDYKVNINSVDYLWHTSTTMTTASGVVTSIMALSGFPGTGVTATVDRATIWLQSASPIAVKAAGPNLDIDMKSYTNTVQNFSDLPTIAPTDYFMEVTGDPSNDFDNFYVKFKPNSAGATFDSGQWVETLAQGIQYKLDAATMPHILIRNGDGTFTFKKAVWNDRKVGDDDTAPIPSFIGKTINDVVFHKDRLGFLSDSNFIGSETGKFFNFFRTTVTALLDTDPIDVSVNQIAILRSAVEFDRELLMFSDTPQFTLGGGDLLTPKTASTLPATKYPSIPDTLPVATDKAVYFAVPKANYSGVRELIIDPVSGKPDAQEVTGHVPKYINGTITKLSVSQTENILVAMADGDRATLWAHNFFWNGDQKLQSAWGKWTFNGSTILGAEFLNSTLYLLLQRTDGVYISKMDVSSSRTDSGDVDHLTNLDMRITEAQATVSYDADEDRTLYLLPYHANPAATYQIVSRFVTEGDIAGVVMKNVTVADNAIACDGDQRAVPVYIGEQYTQQFTLSQQFVTYKDQGGGDVVIPDAKLKLLFMTFMFEKTGYFKVRIDYKHRPGNPQITEFQGRIMASQNNMLDNIALEDGKLRVRVGADSERCTITVINDSFLPANIQQVSWEGRENIRTKQGA